VSALGVFKRMREAKECSDEYCFVMSEASKAANQCAAVKEDWLFRQING